MLNDTAPILPDGTLPIRGELDIEWNGHGWAQSGAADALPLLRRSRERRQRAQEPNGDEQVVCACFARARPIEAGDMAATHHDPTCGCQSCDPVCPECHAPILDFNEDTCECGFSFLSNPRERGDDDGVEYADPREVY